MSDSNLTEAQQLAATNKAKALERLRQKRQANAEPPSTDKAPPPKKAKWIKSFYEYDMSTLVDSKGGYLVDDNEANKTIEERNKRRFEYEPYCRKNMKTKFYVLFVDHLLFLW